MSQRQQIINEIRAQLDTRPKLAKAFLQDSENPDLFRELPDGPLLTKNSCLKIPARRHLFFVRASKGL
jgi:hypothetical protein